MTNPVLDFLSQLATCHACGCSLVFDIGLPHCKDCPASCGDCTEEHDRPTDDGYLKAIEFARIQADAIANLATLIRRLSRRCTDEKLKSQAIGYLDRIGLDSPSILRQPKV